MKKFFALFVSLLLVMGLFAACSSGSDETASPDGTEVAKVYLITMDQMDQHWQNVNKGAEEVAAANSDLVEYKWSAPDKKATPSRSTR